VSAWIPVGFCLVLGLCGSLAAETVGAAQDWWAFRPITSPGIPRGIQPASANPIDAFVRQQLAEKTNVSLATVKRLLKRMTDEKQIAVRKDGRNVVYQAIDVIM
jgi:hypothetical protein